MKNVEPPARASEPTITLVREEDARAKRPVPMSRAVLAASILLALALGACERGHYAARDHVVADESTGAETASDTSETAGTTETASTGETAGTTETASSAETASTTETASAEAASTTDTESADTESTAETVRTDTRGHAPEEEMARARVLEARAVTIRVHATSGPITRAVAERALAMQRMRIDHCYRTVAGPSSAGSMRASIHVEASGAARVELETMTPELDRVLPCVDAALERTPFPASSDGRPTHVVAEVARTP
jgi:hypothetical protein